jgi:hypothetical protein
MTDIIILALIQMRKLTNLMELWDTNYYSQVLCMTI